MKKIISAILGILLILTALPLSTAALTSVDEPIITIDPSQPIKIDTKTPCYGDYEIVVDENEYSTMATDPKDEYESNNSFSAATRINSQPTGAPQSFPFSISATLHRETWLWGAIKRDIDEDYYRLDVFGNAKINVKLRNIPEGCDYDLKLYKFDNVRYAEADDISFITSSINGGNAEENINTTLTPGTYYLWVYSYNNTCDASTRYQLAGNVNYTGYDKEIPQLKYNKGAKAALWVSDYDPCGIVPYTYNDKVEVGYMTADYTAAMKFENPFTQYFTSGQPVEHAVLYIWDINLRNELRAIISSIYDEVNTQLQADKDLLIKLECIESGTGSASTAGSIILSFFKASNKVVPVLNKVFTVAPIVVSIIKLLLSPNQEDIISNENLLDYLRDIRTALEANNQTGTNEVVRIAATYSYSSQNYLGVVQTSYYFDFTPHLQDEYLYNDYTIHAWNSSSIVRGSIYGIVDVDGIQNAIHHGSNDLPDVNTSTLKTLEVDKSMPGYLNEGEYHWFEFTAPTAGTYSFYTENNTVDAYGELFNSIVPATSTTGRLKYAYSTRKSDDFQFEYTLDAGQTVYFRIRGSIWLYTGYYTIRIAKIS